MREINYGSGQTVVLDIWIDWSALELYTIKFDTVKHSSSILALTLTFVSILIVVRNLPYATAVYKFLLVSNIVFSFLFTFFINQEV